MIAERIQFASNFQQERFMYRPGASLPVYDGELRAESDPPQFPVEPSLFTLKYQELALRKTNILFPEEIDLCVALAQEAGKSEALFVKVSAAIRRESTLFNVWREVVNLSAVHLSSVKTNWNVGQIEGEPKAAGRYLDSSNTIHIYADVPTHARTIRVLAKFGELPDPLLTDIHEKTHALQYRLGAPGRMESELMEVQAFRAEHGANKAARHDRLLNFIAGSVLYKRLAREKVEAGIFVVDRLNAMGFSQEQIIYYLKQAGAWNADFGNWEGLETAILQEMQERSFSSEDLERELMADHLKQVIASHQARVAAQKVLYREFKPQVEAARPSRRSNYAREEHTRLMRIRHHQQYYPNYKM